MMSLNELYVPENFPSQPVIDAYLQPNVDRSDEPFEWGQVDMGALRRFALERLQWPYHKSEQYLETLRRSGKHSVAAKVRRRATRFDSNLAHSFSLSLSLPTGSAATYSRCALGSTQQGQGQDWKCACAEGSHVSAAAKGSCSDGRRAASASSDSTGRRRRWWWSRSSDNNTSQTTCHSHSEA